MTTAELLRAHEIRPSPIRIGIYNYLYTTASHLSAEEIYAELLPSLPTLSKTSVYNTLSLFVAASLCKEVTIDPDKIRYEINMSDHGHFICKKCGRIINFDIDNIFETRLSGYEIDFRQVYFGGICKKCNRKNVPEFFD